MSNKFKDIDIKNRTYYFFNDMINAKKFDPNNIELDNTKIFLINMKNCELKSEI